MTVRLWLTPCLRQGTAQTSRNDDSPRQRRLIRPATLTRGQVHVSREQWSVLSSANTCDSRSILGVKYSTASLPQNPLLIWLIP